MSSSTSAGCVPALMHGIYFVLELVVTDRADHDILSDDEGWSAVDLQRISKLHDLVEAHLDLGAFHVLGELVHVESELAGDRQRLGLPDRSVGRQELGMEGPELV